MEHLVNAFWLPPSSRPCLDPVSCLPCWNFRYWRAVRGRTAEVLPLAPPSTACQGHGVGCQLAGSFLVGGGEAGLSILHGRPALRDMMVAAGKAAGAGNEVGVFVGGECAHRLASHSAAAWQAGRPTRCVSPDSPRFPGCMHHDRHACFPVWNMAVPHFQPDSDNCTCCPSCSL